MDFQFYPTPRSLAVKAWAKFKNKDFNRVLEPSAGNGDLAELIPERFSSRIDVCEIDVEKHPLLQAKKFPIVGHDFMSLQSGAHYSHVIMNPPFAYGVQHVLKAWDLLWDGEIVAILNAETVRNAFSKERQLLVALIERHGEVEFHEMAFVTEDTFRRTEVEIALVYLRKKANTAGLFTVGSDSKKDTIQSLNDFEDVNVGNSELVIPKSFIEMQVESFNLAVEALRDAVTAEAKSRRYSAMVGKTMGEMAKGNGLNPEEYSVSFVQNKLFEGYMELKDRAWTSIIRSADVTDRVSRGVQNQIEAEFEKIKSLEFTYDNIHSFIAGLIASASQINLDMALEVFDSITRYHSDNTVFYKGWKSNDKHRTCGMKIKASRFILPRHGVDTWSKQLSWDSQQLLKDFDKVFFMLDGKCYNPKDKENPPRGLLQIFEQEFMALKSGQRVSSEYFDVRYYPGAGTIHFFPKSKQLIDRLNRLVGRHRQWLPPEEAKVSDAFWLQYDKAEKFDAEVRKNVSNEGLSTWRSALDVVVRGSVSDSDDATTAQMALETAILKVLDDNNIDLNNLVTFEDAKNRVDGDSSSEAYQFDLLAA